MFEQLLVAVPSTYWFHRAYCACAMSGRALQPGRQMKCCILEDWSNLGVTVPTEKGLSATSWLLRAAAAAPPGWPAVPPSRLHPVAWVASCAPVLAEAT